MGIELPSGTNVNFPVVFRIIAAPELPQILSAIKVTSPDPVFTLQPLASVTIPCHPSLPFPAQTNNSPPLVVTSPKKSRANPFEPPAPTEGPLPTSKPFQIVDPPLELLPPIHTCPPLVLMVSY